MNALAAAILIVAVAYTNASAIGLGGIIAPGAKGALEGALGGQWIPDVPVAGAGIISPAAAALGAPGLGLGLGLGGLGLGGVGLGGLGWGGLGVSSKGALEGALGGQWIPDTHGK